MIALIAALDRNFLIGAKNGLPWPKIKADMQYFTSETKGNTVLMGRKTWESIPEKYRPLPNRKNVVLTRERGFEAVGAETIYSAEEALETYSKDNLFIIGGSEIYKLFLDHATHIYLTFIEGEFEGDTYFPIKTFGDWREVSSMQKEKSDDTPFNLTFKVYEKE
jgi:dihydrofolate reductase